VGRRIGTNLSLATLPARLKGLDPSLLVAAYTELAHEVALGADTDGAGRSWISYPATLALSVPTVLPSGGQRARAPASSAACPRSRANSRGAVSIGQWPVSMST
jgi:hypothetical protein